MADRQDNRSSDEIRRDIEGTRAEMHETVDALERKLSVGQLVDEVWGRVGGGGSAGSAASTVGDTIRDHPIPLALMGLGVAWLAVDKATGSSHDVGPGTYRRADGRTGPYRGDAVDSDDSSALDTVKDKARSAAETAKGKASEAASTVKSKASDAADTAKRKADAMGPDGGTGSAEWSDSGGRDLGDRASETADRARREAEHRARQAKRGFWSAMEEQPLALGAVAFGLGLAGGLSAPTTRWEDEAMGEAADAVKGEVKREAKDAAGSAKAVAKDAAKAAKEEADRQDVVGDLKESAERIAAEAKDTVEERAQEEDLDPEGMKDRASETQDRAQDKAT